MTPWRIVQISADRGIAPGSTKGAAQHLRGIAAGLRDRGHRVETYSPRSAEGDFPVTVRPLAELDAFHRADEPTVVYERYSLGHRGGLELARRIDAPFVLEVNAPLVDEANRHRPGTVSADDRRNETELLEQADLVIAVSSSLATWAASHRSGPTVAISNGVEPTWFPQPADPGQARRPLVFIGHPKPWHGADRLVDLLVALGARGHRPGLLVIGGGPGADDLRSLAHSAGVGSQLVVTGALPPADASRLLAQGAIGLAPYRRQEPFYFCPLKVIDYLAAGLPVVASDLGDIGGLTGDAGVLVDPDDDAALADAVSALLDDAPRRSTLGRRGRERALASMTWTAVAERTEAALSEVLASTPSPVRA